jgi:murein DD-endopeptidase MepM/ murein hydrolase activator NlpD
MTSSASDRRYAQHHPRERAPVPRRRKPFSKLFSKPLSPGAKLAAGFSVGILFLWSSFTAFYLLFRDDALRVLVAHQTELVRQYDAQIAGLQTQVQRLQSLKLVEQERVDRKVAELARKQAIVEERQETLATLERKTPREAPSTATAPRGPLPDTFPVLQPETPKPSPISDKTSRETSPAPLRSAKARGTVNLAILDRSKPMDARLAALGEGLARIESKQHEALLQTADMLADSEERARAVLADLGIAAPATKRLAAAGGPFIPFVKGNAFDQKLAKARESAANLADLDAVLVGLPVRFPVPRRSEITSGFGARADPFFHQLALHSGVDFRGRPGELVRATAAGRVTTASYHGGYGLMVEIDHGKGFVTRYGHLSAIEANTGDIVQPGEVIGRIGTTGRSTGPHLHYEVRVAGEATNPMRYLRAGERLDGATDAAAPRSPLRAAAKTRFISVD